MFESADAYADFVMGLLEGDEWAPNIHDPHELLVIDSSGMLPEGESAPGLSTETISELERLGLPVEGPAQEQSALRGEVFIWRCADLVIQRLPEDQRREVQRCVAFRGVLNLASSASIYRSPEGYYAIIVSSDLTRLLYLYASFVEAMTVPQNVRFCSIDPLEPRPSADRYRIELASVFDVVRERRFTPVVNILFNEQSARVVAMVFETTLSFVISHELHHFASGELAAKSDRSAAGSVIGEPKFNETQSSELRADAAAFEFMKAVYLPHYIPEVDSSFLAICVWGFFEVLTRAGYTETESHPHPFERFIYICRTCLPPVSGNEEIWSQLVPAAVRYLHESGAGPNSA
jgi:hypothetical protein